MRKKECLKGLQMANLRTCPEPESSHILPKGKNVVKGKKFLKLKMLVNKKKCSFIVYNQTLISGCCYFYDVL